MRPLKGRWWATEPAFLESAGFQFRFRQGNGDLLVTDRLYPLAAGQLGFDEVTARANGNGQVTGASAGIPGRQGCGPVPVVSRCRPSGSRTTHQHGEYNKTVLASLS